MNILPLLPEWFSNPGCTAPVLLWSPHHDESSPLDVMGLALTLRCLPTLCPRLPGWAGPLGPDVAAGLPGCC